LQWIFNAHVIAFGTLLLLGSRLYDTLGHRKIFVIGFTVLADASFLAVIAPTMDLLITARIIVF
jgi:DHA2 family multidrug resistance protein-like MFS transporter